MTKRIVIGIDGGGTNTRVLLMDEDGNELNRYDGGSALSDAPASPVDLDAIETAVVQAFAAARFDLPGAALCAGLAGVGRELQRRAVGAALSARGIAEHVEVITDAEAAFFDAIEDGPGILLIAGTGSIALGRAEDGRVARVGGWGTLIGDEGSAYDIGAQALRVVARAADGRVAETQLLPRLLADLELSSPDDLIAWAAEAKKAEIAALAIKVVELAEAGDSQTEAIVDGAVDSLATHVAALLARLGPWQATPGCALAGGLIAPGGSLRAKLSAALADQQCYVLDQQVDAARGAARHALESLRA
jgi:glucosamine kinase